MKESRLSCMIKSNYLSYADCDMHCAMIKNIQMQCIFHYDLFYKWCILRHFVRSKKKKFLMIASMHRWCKHWTQLYWLLLKELRSLAENSCGCLKPHRGTVPWLILTTDCNYSWIKSLNWTKFLLFFAVSVAWLLYVFSLCWCLKSSSSLRGQIKRFTTDHLIWN